MSLNVKKNVTEYVYLIRHFCGRCGNLMVNVLNFGLSSLGLMARALCCDNNI